MKDSEQDVSSQAGNEPELANEVVWLTDGAPFHDDNNHAKLSRPYIAFDEWRQKLNFGDRMPRGRYFKGKVKQKYVFPFMQLIRSERKRGTFELLNIPFPEAAPRPSPFGKDDDCTLA